MSLGVGSYGLSLLAGMLSTLSPCVLPIVPILLGSSTATRPVSALALGAGLALSYALFGTLAAWGGSAIGFDATIMRNVGAIFIGALGCAMLSPALQQRFATATAGIGKVGNGLIARISLGGGIGQFLIGATLGLVWSPCVGPTLGAAIVMASQGTQLAQVAALMAIFGLGAAAPIAGLGLVSHAAMMKVRGPLMGAGRVGKRLFGVLLLGLALLVLTGADKLLEARLVELSPGWLTTLTTRF